MKKHINVIYFYAILALLGGIFFREFTKLNGFEGVTSLGVIHTHAFMLGMMVFLIILILDKLFHLTAHKRYSTFFIIYNVGLLITLCMFTVRGITQVLQIPLSSGLDASISGIAGIGHIALGIGLFLFLWILKHQVKLMEQK